MKKKIKKNLNMMKWISLIMGILLFILGILYTRNPLEGNMSVVKAGAFILILIGVLKVFRHFSSSIFNSGAFLVGGILDVLFGILVLRNIPATLLSLVLVLGFGVLANGVVQLATSLDLKRLGVSSWWLSLIGAGIGIFVGFSLIGDFGLSLVYISWMIAFNMFATSISLIATFFSLRKLEKIGEDTLDQLRGDDDFITVE